MDRRNFLSHGMLAAGGLSLAACKSASAQSPGPGEKKPPMKYRTLGRTGLVVSEVAFGTYGWQNTAVLVKALEAGVSLICTCADYQSGGAERAVGLAIKGRREREKVSLLSGIDCLRDPGESEMLERLEASLERLGTGWLDIYVPHQADTVANVTNPAIPKAFEKMKAKGKARWLGISTHSGQLEPMLERAIDLGYYDVLLCRYNFMEYKSQMKIFARAAEAGIGVIVFKVHAGTRESELEPLQQKGLDLDQARMRWALSNPNVTSTCVHFTNFSAIDNYLEAINTETSLRDADLLEQYRTAFDHSYCRNCSACEHYCPHGVKVADIQRFGMYFRCYGFEKEAMARYAALPAAGRAGFCRNCPAPCESGCPHGLAIRRHLLEAHAMLTA